MLEHQHFLQVNERRGNCEIRYPMLWFPLRQIMMMKRSVIVSQGSRQGRILQISRNNIISEWTKEKSGMLVSLN